MTYPTMAHDKKPKGPDHPSEDRSLRFALDALLRRNGFRIHSRRKQLDPIWEKQGQLYSQFQALKTLASDDVANARYLQQLYYGDVA